MGKHHHITQGQQWKVKGWLGGGMSGHGNPQLTLWNMVHIWGFSTLHAAALAQGLLKKGWRKCTPVPGISGLLGRFAVHEKRRLVFFDGCLVNNHFLNIAGVGQVKHGANERLLQDGSQTARTRLACQRLARELPSRPLGESPTPHLPWRGACCTV